MSIDYISRAIEGVIIEASKYFSVISVIGPRQSGKSTLIKHLFPQYEKYSMKDLHIREFAENDPVAFLNQHPEGMFIDEVQKVPKLLDYIQKNGTKVYKINNADVILNVIKEEEGFVTELKGIKALYLNFMLQLLCNNKISIKFTTPAMFVLRDLPVDAYYMSHQFYKWFGYKMKLPGYDYQTQKNFKTTFKTLANSDISKLSLDEIIAVKEAINRDNEAIDFVLNLCKETSASKKVLKMILKGDGARI